MKIIKLLFFVTMFSYKLLASAIDNTLIASQELLTEFLRTGTTKSKVLDISQDKKFFIEESRLKPQEKYYQPFEIKNGCLLQIEYMVNRHGEKQKFVSTLIQNTLNQAPLLQCFGIKYEFPNFPILFRASETESLSFIHLTYMWETVSIMAVSIFLNTLEEDFSENAPYLLKTYINAAKSIPVFFQKCYDCGILQHTTDRLEISKFVCEKEEFFNNLRFLKKNITDKIDENEFLKTIYDLDCKLNRAFFKDIFRTLSPKDIVYKGLTSSNELVRDTYAKTLLLHVFMHPDRLGHPELLKQKILCLMPNYGQAARWIYHLTPDNEFTHIFTEKEYTSKKNSQFKKSFWVLKNNATYMDFYNILLSRLKLGQAAFNVNKVEINEKYGYQNIVIDIESDKDQLKWVISEMKALDEKRNVINANGIRFVIRKSEGFFNLITAYPVFLNSITPKLKPTGKLLYRLKDFVDLSIFPECESLAMELT